MFSPLRRILVLTSCLLALGFPPARSAAQSSCPSTSANVTTWHNDNNRTGWQCDEMTLTPATISKPNAFGLLWQ
jgi:hypothetical protein